VRQYAVTVFAVCVISGVLERLSFGGKKDISRLALAVITLYVIISPLASVLGNLDFDNALPSPDGQYGEITEEGYYTVAEKSFAQGIERAVEEKFYLQRGTVRASVEGFSFEKMRAEKIKLTLLDGALWADYQAVENYVNSLEIGKCEVEIEIG
jgi:hypothetical protein